MIRHENLLSPETSILKVGLVSRVKRPGRVRMVATGEWLSTMNDATAGVGSAISAAFTARTEKVCGPSASSPFLPSRLS